ncbi:MATE family efflux transporter [Ruminococcaceae bacterium OttesenSCG-928-L11]|nr:MATE family efflux transporter [Ruminococcaceae bacterium OttesenSCG-928-L11]
MTRILTKDRKFYRQLLTIAVPIALQNLLNFSVSMADTVMLGMLGEVHLSAASLANQLGFIYGLFTFGVAGGSNVMIAQFWGKGDIKSIHKVITIMYRVLFVGGIFFTVLALAFNRQVLGIFSTDPAVIENGAKFLRWVGASYLLMGLASTTVIMLRSVGSVKVALVVSMSSLITNIFFNWVLIFGNLGAPRMEIEGAAIATCIARVVEFTIAMIYMFKVEKKIRYKIRHLFMRKIGIIREFVKNAVPVAVNELIWGMGSAMIAVIIGRMGTEFTAANSICGVLSQLVTITIFGAGNAAAVIIGNTVGGGEYDKAQEYGRSLTFISIGLGLVSCGVVHLLKYPMMSLYNVSETVLLYTGQIINVYSVIVIFQALSAMSIVGVLRGGGDTRFALLMDVVFMWLISIPLGFLTGLGLGWSVPVVYFIIKCDEIFKTFFSFFRIMSGEWVNDVTKVRQVQ